MSDPVTLRAGDSASWSRNEPDYPASAGWSMKWRIVPRAGTPVEVAGVASGDTYTGSITAADSANLPAGFCLLVCVLSRSGEQITRYSGELEIQPNLAALNAWDGRTSARKLLDAVEAALIARADAGQLDLIESTFRDRGWKRSPETLLKLRSQLQAEVARENALAGTGSGGRVYVRFCR